MAKTPDEDFALTKGSRYRLTSVGSRDRPLTTSGTFRGYTSVGSDDAVVMELDESHGEKAGRIRVLPLPAILSIDVLEAVQEERPEARRETMYG